MCSKVEPICDQLVERKNVHRERCWREIEKVFSGGKDEGNRELSSGDAET